METAICQEWRKFAGDLLGCRFYRRFALRSGAEMEARASAISWCGWSQRLERNFRLSRLSPKRKGKVWLSWDYGVVALFVCCCFLRVSLWRYFVDVLSRARCICNRSRRYGDEVWVSGLFPATLSLSLILCRCDVTLIRSWEILWGRRGLENGRGERVGRRAREGVWNDGVVGF